MVNVLQNWKEELGAALVTNSSLCIGVFSIEKDVLFMNRIMSELLKGKSVDYFLNPNFEQIVSLKTNDGLVFDGFLTIGDYDTENISVQAKIYRKANALLVVGGVDILQLYAQNAQVQALDEEITTLRYDLMKEKRALENSLRLLNNANTALQEMNANKDRFISILGHDLKSPFNGMFGFLNLLSENIEQYDVETIKKYLYFVDISAHRTFDLLEDIVLWAKAESGKLPFDPQLISIANLFDNVVSGLELNAKKKQIFISYENNAGEFLFADIKMIQTVLRNLLSNAIKFTEKGGQVALSAKVVAGGVELAVVDNGVGIALDKKEKLFRITEKVSSVGTENERGTGLGLLLCKELVEKHQGRIWVESIVEKGSAFYVFLPKALQAGL